MRKILESPIFEQSLLHEVTDQVTDACWMMEQGQPCDAKIHRLEELICRTIDPFELHQAFSSVKPEAFAKQLLTRDSDFLTDLTQPEMLEVLEGITQVKGDSFQLDFWTECLKRSTRNPRISDLIYWPGSYFGDGDNSRNLSDREILEIALRDADGHAV